MRHEHEVHHANISFETDEEHRAHHDVAMLKHLEIDHGHGEHNGVHHGKVHLFLFRNLVRFFKIIEIFLLDFQYFHNFFSYEASMLIILTRFPF